MSWFTRKCEFCGGEDGDLKRIRKSFAYDTLKHDYHEDCWRKVLGNPQQYGNRILDAALEIDECLSFEAHQRAKRITQALDAYDRLHAKRTP